MLHHVSRYDFFCKCRGRLTILFIRFSFMHGTVFPKRLFNRLFLCFYRFCNGLRQLFCIPRPCVIPYHYFHACLSSFCSSYAALQALAIWSAQEVGLRPQIAPDSFFSIASTAIFNFIKYNFAKSYFDCTQLILTCQLYFLFFTVLMFEPTQQVCKTYDSPLVKINFIQEPKTKTLPPLI